MQTRSLGLLLALLLGACGPSPLQPREPTPGVPHFSIATFNVHFPTGGDTETLDAIAATDADLVFLQETDASWECALTARFSDEYAALRFSPGEGPHGLALLSRFPIDDYQALPAPNDWHPAARAVVHAPLGPLSILHVHLRSKFEGESNPLGNLLATESDHAREMEHFLAAEDELPAIVLGDFNEDPDGGAVGWLEDRGFRNALPLYHPGQFTWRGRSVANQLAFTIDHILFAPSLVPLNARISARGNSDHYPILAHFEAAITTQ
jgi:endonuclease/exonuclease/phosphatase family metal-dependent hydrolase